MACGERLKTLQIVWQPIEQFILVPYSQILRYSCNNTYHKECGILLWTQKYKKKVTYENKSPLFYRNI
jgi:hypothetical protein